MQPLILTARLDVDSQTYFNELRQQHFPPERNYLDAHLTLFHALPGSAFEQIQNEITAAARDHSALQAQATGPKSIGRGVIVVLDCPQLTVIRAALAKSFAPLLTPQDRQGWRPHITVQNKVTSESARILLEQLRLQFQPRTLKIEGLDLWFYEGGPWRPAQSFTFRNRRSVPASVAPDPDRPLANSENES